jgi:outer membrane lipoprotein carrier protein
VRTSFMASLALLALAAGPLLAAGSGTPLDAYLDGLTTWSADFTQTLKEGNKQSSAGRGRLIIVRPGRFRWESAPAGAADAVQLMVADGRDLWFQDSDLDQVIRKPQKDELSQSPAMLLAGDADLGKYFSIQSNGRREGFDWARVVPKDKQSDFREALFGFKGKELARLVIIDKLGQSSTLVFSNVKRNAPVDPKLVQFTVPPGFDLIGEPVK